MSKRNNNQTPPPPAKIKIEVGDYVLLGGTRASYPSNWYAGVVLWFGENDVLVRRSNQNGGSWRDVVPQSHIRAIGSIEHIVSVHLAARDAVMDLKRSISDAESALGKARDALFAKLDELADGGLMILPPDFDQIEADQRVRDASEQYDMELLAKEAAHDHRRLPLFCE